MSMLERCATCCASKEEASTDPGLRCSRSAVLLVMTIFLLPRVTNTRSFFNLTSSFCITSCANAQDIVLAPMLVFSPY